MNGGLKGTGTGEERITQRKARSVLGGREGGLSHCHQLDCNHANAYVRSHV